MPVVQYFKDIYNCNLQYTTWPCLQSGSDYRPVYLPMEVLYLSMNASSCFN
uniref:PAZ domain-containing protein n=1 Tax=Aegilops tauschii subsp. strangulata TaxID=200361 RepID=A0A453EPV0_AEGTS